MKKAMASARMAAFDLSAALERLGGDEELLKEVGILFLQESTMLLGDIRRALQVADYFAVERSAHSLKGSIANFCDGPPLELAREMEMLGRARTLDGAAVVYRELESRVEMLQEEVRGYCS